MSTVQKHSMIQIFIILSSVALIVADLTSGEVSERWNTAAMIIIGVEVVAWQLLRKRIPKDLLVRFHKVLDLVCAFLILATMLLKCIKLIAGDMQIYGIWIGGGGLFVLTIIGFYVYYRVVEKDSKLEEQIESVGKKNIVLQQALNHNLISLDEFLTTASATENNPELFRENFNRFFDITTQRKGNNMFGSLLDVVNENYHHIIDYLKENYPKLIYEELALCALLCLNFSASSIGIIFGNTKASSIYNRRYRLRKKLNITADVQIETFISQIVEKLSEEQSC